MNEQDKNEILESLDLSSKEGFIYGTFRIADIQQSILLDILRKRTADRDTISHLFKHINKDIYNLAINRGLNFDEFISINDNDVRYNQYSLYRYDKSFKGFFEMMKDHQRPLYDFFFSSHKPYFNKKVRQVHTYITGSSGSGKSEILKSLIIQHAEQKDCSIMVIDPKGDLAIQLAKSNVFYENKDRLVIIDPVWSNEKTPIINIFDQFEIKNEQDLDAITQEYSKTFADLFGEGSQLTDRMDLLFSNCTRVILKKKNGSIEDLKRFFSANNQDLIELGKQDPKTKFFFENDFDNKEFIGTKLGIYTRLSKLTQSSIFSDLTTGASTIKLSQYVDKGGIIVFNLAKIPMGAVASKAFGRLIISLVQAMVRYKVNIAGEHRKTTHIFIDEFQNYISDTVVELLNEYRGFKLFLTLVNQYEGQDLDSDAVKSLLTNAKMKFIAQSPPITNPKIAKEMGVSLEDISNLAIGEYYVLYKHHKTGRPITLKIKGDTKYLDNKNQVSNTAWDSLKNEQIRRFYVDRGKPTGDTPNKPQNDPNPPKTPPFEGDPQSQTKKTRKTGEQPLDFNFET